MPSPGKIVGAVVTAPLQYMGQLVDPLLRRWQSWTGLNGMAAFFLAPNMLIFGVFVLIPMGMNIVYSMTSGNALFLKDREFVGGTHYKTLLDCQNYFDPQSCHQDLFWIAAGNTFQFVICQVALMIVVCMITALILNSEIRARSFWRAVFFFPVLLSPVVVGLIWKWILQRDGVLNAVLLDMGLEPINWLIERGWAFFAAITVSVWAHMGFYALILLAGLQAIPKDLYEAAEMDGTRHMRVFWRITLPLLMPNLLVVLVLSLIRAVQIFDEAFVLTGGGPGTATMFLTQYIYEVGFASILKNPGLAAAASILMGGVLIVLTLLQLGLTGRKDRAR